MVFTLKKNLKKLKSHLQNDRYSQKKIKPSKIMLKILKTKISAIACQEMKKRMMKRRKQRLQILVLDKWSSRQKAWDGTKSIMYLYRK